MTVRELIDILSALPPDLPVVVPGTGMQEGGYMNAVRASGALLTPDDVFQYIAPENAGLRAKAVEVVLIE